MQMTREEWKKGRILSPAVQLTLGFCWGNNNNNNNKSTRNNGYHRNNPGAHVLISLSVMNVFLWLLCTTFSVSWSLNYTINSVKHFLVQNFNKGYDFDSIQFTQFVDSLRFTRSHQSRRLGFPFLWTRWPPGYLCRLRKTSATVIIINYHFQAVLNLNSCVTIAG